MNVSPKLKKTGMQVFILEQPLSTKVSVLVSNGCCNKLPQTGWFQVTEMYSLRFGGQISVIGWNQDVSRDALSGSAKRESLPCLSHFLTYAFIMSQRVSLIDNSEIHQVGAFRYTFWACFTRVILALHPEYQSPCIAICVSAIQ